MNLFLLNLFQFYIYTYYAFYYIKTTISYHKLVVILLCGSISTLFFLYLYPSRILSIVVLPILFLASIVDSTCGEIPNFCHILLLLWAFMTSTFHFPIALGIFLIGSLLSYFQLLGFGDTKLLTCWSLLFGKSTLFGLTLSCYIALVIYLCKKEKVRQFPFAPYLAIGLFLASLWFY